MLDITDRVRADEAVARSEEARRLALEAAGVGSWNITLPSLELTGDPKFWELFGAPEGTDYEGAFAIVHSEDRDRVRQAIAAAIDPIDPAPYVAEYRVVYRNSSILWLAAAGRGRFHGDGAEKVAVSVDGSVADVTARRGAEEAVTHERTRQDQTLAAAGIATYDWHAREDRMFGNALFADYFGVPNRPEGNPLSLYFESIHPDDRERIGGQVEEALRTGERYEMRYRVRDADGRERHLLAWGEAALGEDGRPERLFGVFHDETNRTIAEESREASERRLRVALQGGRMGTWDVDLATGTMTCSDACKANYGRSGGDAFSYAELQDAVFEEDRPMWRQTVESAIAATQDFEVEHRVLWPDASLHWVQVRGSCVVDGEGGVTRLSGVSFEVRSADAWRRN